MENTADLIERFNTLEDRACNEVFKLCHRFLCYYARSLSASKEDAEDIVSDAFVQMFKNMESGKQFESLKHVRNYLCALTKNATLNHRQQNNRNSRYQKDFLIVNDLYEDKTDLNRLEAEMLQAIFEAVETLPAACKRIFELSYVHNRSYKQIADELGLSIQTIRNQKTRAILLLRERITAPSGSKIKGLAMDSLLYIVLGIMYMLQFSQSVRKAPCLIPGTS